MVLYQTIPQLNIELLNTYKTRLTINNNNFNEQQKKSQQLTERERRDTIKNLLHPILLSPMLNQKKESLTIQISSIVTTR